MVSIYNMLWQFSNKPVTTILSLLIIVSALVKLFVKKDFKNTSLEVKFILLWFLFPFLLMFFISYYIPIFLDRYLVFVSVAYYFALAV